MTNKPQSDMPDTYYLLPNRMWTTGDYVLSADVPKAIKTISEASHLAALAELEAKHREEMLGLLDEVEKNFDKKLDSNCGDCDWWYQDAMTDIIISIKQRIEESHE